jgi:sensor c-di-GMP phosphodiesterase-like protein
MWINGFCCCPWISCVSKSSTIFLISCSVHPHIKSRASLLPDNLRGDHDKFAELKSSHAMLFLSAASASTPITFLFSAPYSHGLHLFMPHGFVIGCVVMVLWLTTYGAATKPRASCGRAHMVELLSTRWYHG